jgi:hypothetical protein
MREIVFASGATNLRASNVDQEKSCSAGISCILCKRDAQKFARLSRRLAHRSRVGESNCAARARLFPSTLP